MYSLRIFHSRFHKLHPHIPCLMSQVKDVCTFTTPSSPSFLSHVGSNISASGGVPYAHFLKVAIVIIEEKSKKREYYSKQEKQKKTMMTMEAKIYSKETFQ